MEAAVEDAKRRCRAMEDRVKSLTTGTGTGTGRRLSESCCGTLIRLVQSELSFLSRFSLSSPPQSTLSVNIGHLEAVVHILEQPFVTGVSRVCKPISLGSSAKDLQNSVGLVKSVHIDIVCTVCGNPVWFIVSDRNPKYVSWHGTDRNKGLGSRIEQVLDVARSCDSMKPCSVVLFFSNGLDHCLQERLRDEYGAADFNLEFSNFDCGFTEELDADWVNVLARSYHSACVLEIKVDKFGNAISRMESGAEDCLSCSCSCRTGPSNYQLDLKLGSSFCNLVSGMKLGAMNAEVYQPQGSSNNVDMINFDTTAMIAIISGISNGSTKRLLATPENELRSRFKSNFEFVITQVMSEIHNPILEELHGILSGKKGMICESVCSEFREIVSMCGGPNEKLRANYLLKHIMVVPDCPSARMMGLPTTRKLALKNKVVFGTGDHWHAPTLTANMAFVRAVSQTGMPLFTIEHRPRALTGD